MCDPDSGFHFILNEPYSVDMAKQGPFLAAKCMEVHTSRDWTIHNPMGTLAQLIAQQKDAGFLKQLIQRCEALPERFSQIRFTDDDGPLSNDHPLLMRYKSTGHQKSTHMS